MHTISDKTFIFRKKAMVHYILSQLFNYSINAPKHGQHKESSIEVFQPGKMCIVKAGWIDLVIFRIEK